MRGQVEVDDRAALYMSVSPFSINFPDPGYRAIRTGRYTRTRMSDGECHLYDDLNDPYQLNNLAEDAATADVRTESEKTLAQLLAQIDDPFHKESYYLEKWGYQVDEIGNVPYTK